MKMILSAVFLMTLSVVLAYSQTRTIAPRADTEGGLGAADARWGEAHVVSGSFGGITLSGEYRTEWPTGGGTSLTNSAGAEITVASTNETSTSETEVLTAGAVDRLFDTAGNLTATNGPATVGDVLRVSQTGTAGRATMQYRTRAYFYADKNEVNQTIAYNTNTDVTWATNNMVNTGHWEMRNSTDTATGTTHIKYVGDVPITVIINASSRTVDTFTAGAANLLTYIYLNDDMVASGANWGARRVIIPLTHIRTIEPNDLIMYQFKQLVETDLDAKDLSGNPFHTNIQIAEL